MGESQGVGSRTEGRGRERRMGRIGLSRGEKGWDAKGALGRVKVWGGEGKGGRESRCGEGTGEGKESQE